MAASCKKIRSLLISFCLLFAGTNLLIAQRTDSLLHLLHSATRDSARVVLLNDIARYLFEEGSFDSSIVYANRAQKIASSIGYTKGMASAHNKLGNAYEKKGDYREALKNHLAALKLVQELNDQRSIASCYNNIGILYENQGNYPEALKNYYVSQHTYEKIGDKAGVALLNNGIGAVYKAQGNYQQAIKSFTSSLEILRSLGDKRGVLRAYASLGNLYSDQKKRSEALLNISLAIAIAKEINDRESMANCYNDMANVYADLGNYPEALKNYFASLKVATEIGSKPEMAITFGNIGEAYIDLRNYSEAKKYLTKALDLSKQIGGKESLRDHYRLLAVIDSASGNYKDALEHTRLYYAYNDSIYNEENARQINELSAKYENEKKEKEIALLNASLVSRQKDKEALSTRVDEKNKMIIATFLVAALLLTAVLLFFSRRQLKQKKEISEQQKNIASAIIQTQEMERNRIAKDLHDGVGTFLSTLKINLQLLENAVASEKIPSYQNAMELADKTSVELRNIIKNMSSETLLECGLGEALEELVQGINRLRVIRVEFITHGITKRPEEIIEVTLYRVAQELVINCIKHAQASKATLQLIAHADSLLLMLEDNGVSLSVRSSKPRVDTGGMGLKNVYDRINFIKGTIKIESNPQRGTTFIIEVPKHLA